MKKLTVALLSIFISFGFIIGTNAYAETTSVPTTPIIIYSCQEITTPGDYVLDSDLYKEVTPCINIHDTENVSLTCNNHKISASNSYGVAGAINIKNTKNFSVNLCNIDLISMYKNDAFFISNSVNGDIHNNTLGLSGLYVEYSSGLNIHDNIFNSAYWQQYTNGTILKNNTFTNKAMSIDVVTFKNGFNNNIIGNIIDGAAEGVYSKQIGADDGIVIFDESGDLISNNNIKNNWDCGIETLGLIENSKFESNDIKNSGLCGIGGWFYSSLKNNVFSNNIIGDSPTAFYFFREEGLRSAGWDDLGKAPADTGVYFTDNQFIGNKFTNQSKDSGSHLIEPISSRISIKLADISIIEPWDFNYRLGERLPKDSEFFLKNNLFKNNDFSTLNSLDLFPFSMIVDGGGNICKQGANADFPLKCLSTASSAYLTLLSPNINTTWAKRTPQAVTWTSSGISASSTISYFRLKSADGREYNLPVSSYNDGGELIIMPPNVPIGSYRLEIKSIVDDKSYIASSPLFKVTENTTVDKVAPATPTDVSVKTSAYCGGLIDLSWSPVPGAVGYKVYGTPSSKIITPPKIISSASYIDKISGSPTYYSYNITAFNSKGESLKSSTLKALSSPACLTASNSILNKFSLAFILEPLKNLIESLGNLIK